MRRKITPSQEKFVLNRKYKQLVSELSHYKRDAVYTQLSYPEDLIEYGKDYANDGARYATYCFQRVEQIKKELAEVKKKLAWLN